MEKETEKLRGLISKESFDKFSEALKAFSNGEIVLPIFTEKLSECIPSKHLNLAFNISNVAFQKQLTCKQKKHPVKHPVKIILTSENINNEKSNENIHLHKSTEEKCTIDNNANSHINDDSDTGSESNNKSTDLKKDSKNNRLRKEWSETEDRLFLDVLKKDGADFKSIGAVLPHRTRSQIRTHYRYLANTFISNLESARPCRRIKVRGRPKSGSAYPPQSTLLKDLQEIIEKIEARNINDRKRRMPELYNKLEANKIANSQNGIQREIAPRPPSVPVRLINGAALPPLESPKTMYTLGFNDNLPTMFHSYGTKLDPDKIKIKTEEGRDDEDESTESGSE